MSKDFLVGFIQVIPSRSLAPSQGPNPFSQNDSAEKEWESCRDLLAKFDERIHDLRKLGFTFLTTLLTAEALLIPSYLGKGLPGYIKLTVIVGTLLLILTLRLVEKNYELFQRAAATRGVVLERNLNFELTDIISARSRSDHFSIFVTLAYTSFALVAGLLGYFILLPSYQTKEVVSLGLGLLRTQVLAVFLTITIASLLVIDRLSIVFTHRENDLDVDWSVDRLECKRNHWVRITLTNFGKKCITFERGETPWVIRCEDPTKKSWKSSRPVEARIEIYPYSSYTWFWKPGRPPRLPGAYRIHVQKPHHGWWSNLRRFLIGKEEMEFVPLKKKLTVY